MTKVISVLVTMDCEPPVKPGARNASGPRDWEQSERFIRGYDAIAARHGFPVSYFLHPEVAEAHAPLFFELERSGACIDGLHLHPWKFDEQRYRAHFGGLTQSEQRDILREASALYEKHMGRRPRYFRPGTFSANDFTFPVLEELGFDGGSVSAPERNFPDLNANWVGAPRDPHRAHRCFRQRSGSLGFVNIPLTSDFETDGILNGRPYPRDLRPDYPDDEAGFSRIVENIVGQVLGRNPGTPVVNIVTHNDNDFSDPENRIARNLDFILGQIHAHCRAHGAEAKGKTITDVVSSTMAADQPEAGFVYA